MEHFCFCLKNNPFSALSVGGLAFLLICTYVPIYSSPFGCCFVHCLITKKSVNHQKNFKITEHSFFLLIFALVHTYMYERVYVDLLEQ